MTAALFLGKTLKKSNSKSNRYLARARMVVDERNNADQKPQRQSRLKKNVEEHLGAAAANKPLPRRTTTLRLGTKITTHRQRAQPWNEGVSAVEDEIVDAELAVEQEEEEEEVIDAVEVKKEEDCDSLANAAAAAKKRPMRQASKPAAAVVVATKSNKKKTAAQSGVVAVKKENIDDDEGNEEIAPQEKQKQQKQNKEQKKKSSRTTNRDENMGEEDDDDDDDFDEDDAMNVDARRKIDADEAYKADWTDKMQYFPIDLAVYDAQKKAEEMTLEDDSAVAGETKVVDNNNRRGKTMANTLEELRLSNGEKLIALHLPPDLPFANERREEKKGNNNNNNNRAQKKGNKSLLSGDNSNNSKKKQKLIEVANMKAGQLGEIHVYADGTAKLVIGECSFDLENGANFRHHEQFVVLDEKKKKCAFVGDIVGRVVATPDVDQLIEHSLNDSDGDDDDDYDDSDGDIEEFE